MNDKRIELMKMRTECVKIAASYQSRFEDVTEVASVLFSYISTGIVPHSTPENVNRVQSLMKKDELNNNTDSPQS